MNTLRCLPAVAVARAPLRRRAAATSTPQQASPASKTRSEQPPPAPTVMTPGPGPVPGLPATPGSGRSTAAIQPAYRETAGRSWRASRATGRPPGPGPPAGPRAARRATGRPPGHGPPAGPRAEGRARATRPAHDHGRDRKFVTRACEPRVAVGRLYDRGAMIERTIVMR